jgi:molybdopterin/thiamine biosynthesis adenylyltransferase/rhodanese-related sulfurtransferase
LPSARYARQVAMPEIGLEGQRRLFAAHVLIVGAGGLGSPAALYLAAAGIGTITLVDFDDVDESNLQRQVIYTTADIGRSKLEAAGERLRALNPEVRVIGVDAPFSTDNARRLVAAADVVIDGTDNFGARYLVNDASVLERRPNVFGSVAGFEGQAAVFAAPGGPCYRCLHPEPPPDGAIPSCAEAGILGVLPGLIGIVQATECIKLLTGVGEPLIGRMLLYDARRMRARSITIPRDAECPVCGDRPRITDVEDIRVACSSEASWEIAAAELRRWQSTGRPHVLLDVREPWEHAVSSIADDRLAPLGELDRLVPTLPTDRPIVVYCETGRRSGQAAGRLRLKGLEAVSLSGGIRAWQR